MADLHQYMWQDGNLPLSQLPFNEVDALVFARLAYLPFDLIGLDQSTQSITIKDAARALLLQPETAHCLAFQADLSLIRDLAVSRRFGSMRLSRFVNQIEEVHQTQFAAVTIQVADRLSYLAFRGTDDSLAGWKENLNMGVMFPVPAQNRALQYLMVAAASHPGQLMLGGHSKGGNLAMYAASCCGTQVQGRIEAIHNFDGPGFTNQLLDSPGYQRICPKITSFIPQHSIIGLLLGHTERHVIVRSSEKAIKQHDISSWQVRGTHLVHLDQLSENSRLIDLTLSGWIAELNLQQRKRFIDTLYLAITNLRVHTFPEFGKLMDKRRLTTIVSMLATVGKVDRESREALFTAVAVLIKNIRLARNRVGHYQLALARNNQK